MDHYVVSTSCQMALLHAHGHGRSCAAALESAGISDAEIRTPGLRIASAKISRFWDGLAAAWRDPSVGFTVAASVPFGTYLLPNLLAAGSRSVGEGLERGCANYSLIHTVARLTVRKMRQFVRIEFDYPNLDAISPHYVDYVLTTLVLHSRCATGVNWRPAALRQRAKTRSVPARMRQFFGGRVVTECDKPGFDVSLRDWHCANHHAVPGIVDVLEAESRRQLRHSSSPPGYCEVLGQMVRASLGKEPVTIAHLAGRLSISKRTLQRKLTAESTTFKDIVDGARRALADAYLGDPSLTMSQIGYLLGYSEPSAFLRARRRWNRRRA